jgi:hypothetical protein
MATPAINTQMTPALDAPPDDADVSASPPSDDGADGGGYVIEIQVKPDGTFAVMQEGAAADTATGGQGAEDQGAQTYDDIGAALKAVLDIIKANPPSGESPSDQFDAGFADTSGPTPAGSGGKMAQKY